MGKYSRILCGLLLTGYLIGVHDSRVALWQGQDPEPIHVTSYPVALLPLKDQTDLAAGIQAATSAEAARLLEDFTS